MTDWLNGEISAGFEGLDGTSPIPIPLQTQQKIRRVLDLVLAVRKFPRRELDHWDMAAVEELDGILAQYPKIYSCQMGGFGFAEFRRIPIDHSVDQYEAGAVESILELAHGGLEKLRQCRCGTWYFARKSDHNSCSQSCRKAKHEQTPAYKAHKAAKAKANYHTKKTLPIR